MTKEIIRHLFCNSALLLLRVQHAHQQNITIKSYSNDDSLAALYAALLSPSRDFLTRRTVR